VNNASDDVSQDPSPDSRPVRQREACPPPRLLIGYEHAGCNTNTDVILPATLPELTSAEAIDAFEPKVAQLADRHQPTCPVCAAPMNFVVWGPHDDEVEGRWPLAGSIDARKPGVRSWRDSGVAWFWSDAREDFGSVVLEAGRYVASTVRGSASFEVLADAKKFVEEHSS